MLTKLCGEFVVIFIALASVESASATEYCSTTLKMMTLSVSEGATAQLVVADPVSCPIANACWYNRMYIDPADADILEYAMGVSLANAVVIIGFETAGRVSKGGYPHGVQHCKLITIWQ